MLWACDESDGLCILAQGKNNDHLRMAAKIDLACEQASGEVGKKNSASAKPKNSES